MTDNAQPLRLYLLTQTVVTDYDTYDSAVVCAESEDAARLIHPGDQSEWYAKHQPDKPPPNPWPSGGSGTWADRPDQVQVKCIGTAAPDIKPGLVLASFNAG